MKYSKQDVVAARPTRRQRQSSDVDRSANAKAQIHGRAFVRKQSIYVESPYLAEISPFLS